MTGGRGIIEEMETYEILARAAGPEATKLYFEYSKLRNQFDEAVRHFIRTAVENAPESAAAELAYKQSRRVLDAMSLIRIQMDKLLFPTESISQWLQRTFLDLTDKTLVITNPMYVALESLCQGNGEDAVKSHFARVIIEFPLEFLQSLQFGILQIDNNMGEIRWCCSQ